MNGDILREFLYCGNAREQKQPRIGGDWPLFSIIKPTGFTKTISVCSSYRVLKIV